MRRVLRVAIFIALLFSAKGAFAGNWYVHKGATGSNNGTSWTNAWNEMNQINFSTVACGDTVWLAGGTYTTDLSINKTCTSGTVLNIKRVLSSDAVPVAAAGWNSSFDSQVIISNGSIPMSGAYWTVDGRVGTVAGNNFGISLPETGGNYAIQLGNGVSANHLEFHYVEVHGPACVTSQSCTSDTHAVDFRNFSGTGNTILFDHCWFHRESELIWMGAGNLSNITFQYTDIDTTATTSDEHADIDYLAGSITNLTFRYNRIWASDNDGLLWESGGTYNGFYFYGNMYYYNMGQIIAFKSGSNFSNVFMYNNVFEWDGSFHAPSGNNFACSFNNSSYPTSGAFENNIVEGCSVGLGPQVTSDYNAYSSSVGKGDSGAHSFTYTKGSQFVNEPDSGISADFHLTSTGAASFQNGVALSSPYNLDADGNTRGANGHWYIGAYQYGANSGSGPQPPTGLTITVQ